LVAIIEAAALTRGLTIRRAPYCDGGETVSEIRPSKGNPMRIITVLLGAAILLSACNTVRGIGRDVESVGETVADTAD
jgi:predicted small secreted protein